MKHLFVLLLLVSCACSITIQASPYKEIVVFGDSYSDNGNTYRVSANTYPTTLRYFHGRFSNGPVWTEYFSKKMGFDPKDYRTFRNYAYGQAQALGNVNLITHHLNESWQFVVPDLHGEVTEYLLQGSENISQTLFIIFIGTNDILNIDDLMSIDLEKTAKQILAPQINEILRLENLGAKYFIVLNARDLAATPLAKQQALNYVIKNSGASTSQYLRRLQQLIKRYNQLLAETLRDHSEIKIFDTYAFDQSQINLMQSNECYINHGNYIDPASKICDKPDSHFYYDRVHLSTATNEKLASAVFNWINA